MSDFLSTLAGSSRAARSSRGDRVAAKALIGAPAGRKNDQGASARPSAATGRTRDDEAARIFARFRATVLFDDDYYRATYPDIVEARVDPLEHFFYHGYREGRRPNRLFDPTWYLKT